MALRDFYQALTVAGTVVAIDDAKPSFSIRARTGDVFEAVVGPTTYYRVLENLDALGRDRVADPAGLPENANGVARNLRKYITMDRPVWVEGILYLDGNSMRYEARDVHLVHSEPGKWLFEETHWWLVQISQMADRWLDFLFDARRSYEIDDFSNLYATNLNITGQRVDENIQECATLSRLIYGLSSAYLMTGADRYFLAAKAGVEYQREAFRSLSHDGEYCFWAFGRRRLRGEERGEKLIIESENPDDRGSIPLYEQIYALAGLTQYYRITLDWEVLEDIRRTVNAFQAFYWDYPNAKVEKGDKGFTGTGGYFSHIDFATMRPDTQGLVNGDRDNRQRKNWNSVGDHIPAYLVNLILALDPLPKSSKNKHLEAFRATCRQILEETSQLIVEKFPDPDSDYVNEKFLHDWTPDHGWFWQQNRGIVGHNLKISWNLTRVAFYFQCREKEFRDRRDFARADDYKARAGQCLDLARRLGRKMADVGLDKLRGGIFDAVERQPPEGMDVQFAWGTTKDFWQQEQGILAYLIMHGADSTDQQFLALARESTAFWNLFFLDRERQGVYFRVTENGLPYLYRGYAIKGGHAVAGYHSFELNYLAHFYTRSFVRFEGAHDNDFCMNFKVCPRRDQESINVLPDFAPPGLLHIKAVRIDGVDRTDEFSRADLDNFQVPVARSDHDVEVQVFFTTNRG